MQRVCKKGWLVGLLVLCVPLFVSAHVDEPPTVDAHQKTFSAHLTTIPVLPQGGDLVTFSFSITDEDGNPAQDLEIAHERILHVLLVREDLTGFAHVHPEDAGPLTEEQRAQATFSVPPRAFESGLWRIVAQFTVGEQEITNEFTLSVGGAAGPVRIEKDIRREKSFGGYDVTISTEPESITAGAAEVIAYTITKDDKNVSDLTPYLGAAAHFAIWSADLATFTHEHGVLQELGTMDNLEQGHEHGGGQHEEHMPEGSLPAAFGPAVFLHYTFPYPGLYKIFGQFARGENVLTTDFMVAVAPPQQETAVEEETGEDLHPPVDIGTGFQLTTGDKGITTHEAMELNEGTNEEATRSLIKIFASAFMVLALALLFWPPRLPQKTVSPAAQGAAEDSSKIAPPNT